MSKIEVDAIDKQSGSTLTLGGSGTAVTLACGATQTGFGREGSVNWQTGSLKTSTFTAVSGEGYFINSGSAITMNLPAGSAGAIVAVSDYATNFSTYNLTISPNGSEKIGGIANDATLNVDGQAATFVYVDSTKGWVNVQNAEDTERGISFITATGGTVTTVCTNFKVHTFTAPGTFCVSCSGSAGGSNTIDYLVVGGGGAGNTKNSRNPTSSGRYSPGGGGAGGIRISPGTASGCWASSPLGTAPAVALPVAATGYPVTVGAGGSKPSIPATDAQGNPGSNSVFAGTSTITGTGGGGGGYGGCAPFASVGADGGSGGGGGGGPPSFAGGTGNTPSTNPAQGQNGGSGNSQADTQGGGGGGAGAVGGNSSSTPSPRTSTGGDGGAGVAVSITGSPVSYAGGGGGGAGYPGCGGGTVTPGAGGAGGGGRGGGPPSNPTPRDTTCGEAGTANTGGGGGGAGGTGATGSCGGGNGGSGIVVIRYRFQ